jgi:hypothetical protein
MKKGNGRPIMTLVDVAKEDMSIKEVTKSMILDKIEWRKIIYVADLD